MPNQISDNPGSNSSLIPYLQNPLASEVDQRIVLAAEMRIKDFGEDYSTSSSPRSPNPAITSNKYPNHSRLKGRSKCNQFVGDVLFDAGAVMPTFRMPDGSFHYVNAERSSFALYDREKGLNLTISLHVYKVVPNSVSEVFVIGTPYFRH